MVDHADIIYMNGRIYDSQLGRFLQADPFIQAPKNSQSYNRYSYVLNNPLSYTDPSGYLFSGLKKFVKKYWKTALAIAASYVTFGLATGAWSFSAISNLSIGAMIGGGAAAGFVSGAITTGSFKGALTGALSGAVFGAIGGARLGGWETFALSGISGGIMSELQQGKFGHGFVSAGLGAATGGMVGKGVISRIISSAIIGGAISKIIGGKFANGAFSGSFARTLDEAKQGNLFAKEDSAGKTSFKKKVDIVKGNLADLDDAKQYVNETYDNLLDGIDIEFANLDERNFGQACLTDSCIQLNFEKIHSGN